MKKKININGSEYEFTELRELKLVLLENNITISSHVEVGDNCKIGKYVVFETTSKIGDFVTVSDGVRLGADCKVGDHSFIGVEAVIETCARVGKNVSIGFRVTIGEEAIIKDNEDLPISILIRGSAHPVTYTGSNTISIGCINKSIDDWKKTIVEEAKKHKYKDSQISEYIKHINTVETFLKDNNARLNLQCGQNDHK